jgi:muramoyltetrapeptide carboxypeptidase
VWASRGGYGVTRILDLLDWNALAADPKLLVGFSDLTALLLAAWTRLRLTSIHGQFVGRLGLQPPATLELLHRLVTTTEPLGALDQPDGGPPLRVVTPGKAEGPLMGGNLALLTSLVGTAHMPSLDGAILVLEDVSEAPYRLDRMLTQLRHAGILAGVAGVVVAELRACFPPSDRPSLTVDETIDACLGDLGVPVVHGLAIGHVDRQIPLPLGVRARLQATEPPLDLLGSPCESR